MNLSPESMPSDPSLLLKAMEAELKQRQAENQLPKYAPYNKQKEFHAAGAKYRERLLMAGNQLGKTLAAGNEVAMHLTGLYPDWWEGKRFTGPVVGWASGVTGESTRDNPQRILLGRPGEWGTGTIPKSKIENITRASHSVADAVDGIRVEHVSGGYSLLAFKAYEKGREKWQGETLDFVWFDEEPPLDIYTEGMTRTNKTLGPVFMTFTPLLGMSEVVSKFLVEQATGTHVTNMTIFDVGHYDDVQRAAIIASYPAHERDARAKGIPTMGSGLIFPVEEESIICAPFAIPKHWPQINGMDFGYDHPTAASNAAWDREADVWYVTKEFRERKEAGLPAMTTAAVKPWGDWIPVMWPHDGLQHDKGSGDELAGIYRKHGLKMHPEKATHPPAPGDKEGTGGNGVEAGLQDMLERMLTGRWKVFSTCTQWLEERRLYHRKDGKIIKERDDLISSSRYAYMMRRHAITKPVAAPSLWGKQNTVGDRVAGY